MAKIIDSGLVPADDPMFNGSLELFSKRAGLTMWAERAFDPKPDTPHGK
jgi:hypothetical protein